MPPRSQTLPDGIHRLTKLIAHLNSAPKLSLQNVKNIRICLAAKNDHFGARHFVKEELPRIRYANPDIGIEVKRAIPKKDDSFRATLDLELADGTKKELDLQDKWSSVILQELMDTAGGDAWKRYKAAANADGLPVVPGLSKAVTEPREKVAAEAEAAGKGKKKPLLRLEEWLKVQEKNKKQQPPPPPQPAEVEESAQAAAAASS